MEIIRPDDGLALLQPGDYREFLLDLETHSLMNGPITPETIISTIEILNKSYGPFGEVSVTSARATEVVTVFSDPLLPETVELARREGHDIDVGQRGYGLGLAYQKVFSVPDFEHSGFCLGFAYDVPRKEFVARITDDENPFRIENIDRAEVLHRMFYVPIMEEHSIAIREDYELSF